MALDSLPGLIASKMVALVERGAPRDFRDVYSLCQAGLASARECWRLWEDRQRQAASDADPRRARFAVETHLTRIALHRLLDRIGDPAERAPAYHLVRSWHGLPSLPYLGQQIAAIRHDPSLRHV